MGKKREGEKKRPRTTVQSKEFISLMKEHGFSSVRELSLKAGVSVSVMGKLVNMQASPLRANMKWKNSVIKLADFLRCLPEDLFGEEHIDSLCTCGNAEEKEGLAEVYRMVSVERAEAMFPENAVFENERIVAFSKILSRLTIQEKEVIRMRFGLDDGREPTLEEVGDTIGVVRERVRQIESSALKKLRHPHRIKMIKELCL